jgi:N-methylhydantoinase A
MEKAIRVVSIEQGYDPREFSLLAFGGAGALHACELAASLSIPRVIVPPYPGALSAYGILVSDVVKDFSRTTPKLLSRDNFAAAVAQIRSTLEELEQAALEEYETEGWKGKPRLERSADLRYQGQGYELRIPWRNSPSLLEDFHAAHQRRFGYRHAANKIEVVTLRVRASLGQQQGELAPPKAKLEKVPQRRSSLYVHGKSLTATTLKRDALSVGFSALGPVIVTEYTATTFVASGWRVTAHDSGALVLEAGNGKSAKKRRSK